jgi:hypothetical protein
LAPRILNIDGDRIAEGLLLVFWLREMYTSDINTIIPTSQPYVSPSYEYSKMMTSFVLHYKVMAYQSDHLGIDVIDHEEGIMDVLFARCSDCPVILRNGLQAAGLELENSFDEVASRIEYRDPTVTWNDVLETEQLYWDIKDSLTEIIEIYEEDNIKIIEGNLNQLYPISTAFSVVCFVVLIVTSYHYINKILVTFEAEVYLLQLFLNNDVEQFKGHVSFLNHSSTKKYK